MSKDPRIKSVHKSNVVFFWSPKHKAIIKATSQSFRPDQPCELCTKKWPLESTSNMYKFPLKFESFNQFKSHIIKREFRYARPLIWSTEAQIPIDVKRERELGDLISLKDEKVLKIEFDDVTLVKNRKDLLRFFKKNGCQCNLNFEKNKREAGTCNVMLDSINVIWRHLSAIEKFKRKYMVFKGDASEITSDETFRNIIAQRAKINPLKIEIDDKERKLGDLTMVKDEPILKFVFESVTFTEYKANVKSLQR